MTLKLRYCSYSQIKSVSTFAAEVRFLGFASIIKFLLWKTTLAYQRENNFVKLRFNRAKNLKVREENILVEIESLKDILKFQNNLNVFNLKF